MKIDANRIFNNVINVVFSAILLAIIIALAVGVVKLFYTILQTLTTPGVTGQYLNLITDILTLFILVELSKSLVDYFHKHRLRMTFIVDAAIVFMIREVMIMLFQHKASPDEIYAISALLLVLTVLRIGSILMFQREAKVVSSLEDMNPPE